MSHLNFRIIKEVKDMRRGMRRCAKGYESEYKMTLHAAACISQCPRRADILITSWI